MDVIEYLATAGYLPKEKKAIVVGHASTKLDMVKFFLKIAWQAKAIDNKKYTQLSAPVAEIGRMLGGWRKQLANE